MTVEGTVSRAVLILRALVESEGDLSILDLATQLDLPTSTVHRILQMLRAEGMTQHDPATRRYRPGPTLLRMSALLGERQSLDQRAVPHLRSIVNACNENAQFGVLLPADLTMMFTQQVQSTHPLRFNAELYVPVSLVWGCSGQVILAHLPPDDIAQLLIDARPSAITSAPVPTLEAFEQTLSRVREQGWNETRGEKLAESVGFAAPVFSSRGIAGSISITIPAHRFDDAARDRYASLVVEAGTSLSHELGHA